MITFSYKKSITKIYAFSLFIIIVKVCFNCSKDQLFVFLYLHILFNILEAKILVHKCIKSKNQISFNRCLKKIVTKTLKEFFFICS